MFSYSGFNFQYFGSFCDYLEDSFGITFPSTFREKDGKVMVSSRMDSSDLGVLGLMIGGDVDVTFEYTERSGVVYATIEFDFDSKFVRLPGVTFYFDYDIKDGIWFQERFS